MKVFFKSEFGEGVTNEERNEALYLAMQKRMVVDDSFTVRNKDIPSFRGDGVVKLSNGKKVRVRTLEYTGGSVNGGVSIDNIGQQMADYIEALEKNAIPTLPLAVIKYGMHTVYDEQGGFVKWTMPESVIEMSQGRRFKTKCNKYGHLEITAI